jgi:Tfp pilus assembly protein PilO
LANIKEARRRFSLVLIVLVAVCLMAAGVLISPIGKSSRGSRERIQTLWNELRVKDREVMPLRGIDKKVVTAKEQISDFYETRLPFSYASVFDQLGKLASANGVRLGTGHYRTESSDVPDLERVDIEANVSGDYLRLVKFINAVERDKMFFIIDSVAFGEQQAGVVNLQIRMETYLRGAPPSAPGQNKG